MDVTKGKMDVRADKHIELLVSNMAFAGVNAREYVVSLGDFGMVGVVGLALPCLWRVTVLKLSSKIETKGEKFAR